MTDDAWRVQITRPATRDLKRLDAPVRERILAAFDGLKTDPAKGDIKRLAGPKPPQEGAPTIKPVPEDQPTSSSRVRSAPIDSIRVGRRGPVSLAHSS